LGNLLTLILSNQARIKIFFLILITFFAFSCDEVKNDDELVFISNSQFTFHQDVNKLYFAAYFEKMFSRNNLDSAFVEWYGISENNTKDILKLYDDGTRGDIITGDNLHGLKIPNEVSNIQNILNNDSGYVYFDYKAFYGSEVLILKDSTKIGNIIPRVLSINAPDTIIRPSDATIILATVSAEVVDVDGLETIKWVGFTSYHVDGDSAMNKGDYIYLYDDGSSVVLYEPNFTSGDEVKGDGIFSFRIPIYGTGFTDPGFQTKAGNFVWRFSSQDLSNDYSNEIEHAIIIQ
jgi:hypothetical protein